ncbi:MAG: hypothetical protein FWF76_07070 [Oscillospiraceae bacterium]|nr:hypothetical protein [Oscillospiraceae bacterium]
MKRMLATKLLSVLITSDTMDDIINSYKLEAQNELSQTSVFDCDEDVRDDIGDDDDDEHEEYDEYEYEYSDEFGDNYYSPDCSETQSLEYSKYDDDSVLGLNDNDFE